MCIELAKEKEKKNKEKKKERIKKQIAMVSFPKILMNSISKWNNFDSKSLIVQ